MEKQVIWEQIATRQWCLLCHTNYRQFFCAALRGLSHVSLHKPEQFSTSCVSANTAWFPACHCHCPFAILMCNTLTAYKIGFWFALLGSPNLSAGVSHVMPILLPTMVKGEGLPWVLHGSDVPKHGFFSPLCNLGMRVGFLWGLYRPIPRSDGGGSFDLKCRPMKSCQGNWGLAPENFEINAILSAWKSGPLRSWGGGGRTTCHPPPPGTGLWYQGLGFATTRGPLGVRVLVWLRWFWSP